MEPITDPVKTHKCKCGSKDAKTSTKSHCKTNHCPCRKHGEPCLPDMCDCRGCKNPQLPTGSQWLLPPELQPKTCTLDDETGEEGQVHGTLTELKKGTKMGHLRGTTGQDGEQRDALQRRDYRAATCPQCGRQEATFLTWVAAHVTLKETGHYYLLRTCSSCNVSGSRAFALRRKTFALLLCAHGKECTCDTRYRSKIAEN